MVRTLSPGASKPVSRPSPGRGVLLAVALLSAAPAALAQDNAAPTDNAAVLAQQCVSCHGEEAVGRRIPPLMGVDQNHIVSAMEDFRAGRRDNPAMMSIARNLSPQEVQEIARYFAQDSFGAD